MTVELYEQNDGKIISLKINGQLHKEDYELLTPRVERFIEQYGKIRLMVEMADFHGWDTGALWEDIKFDVRNFSKIERIAFVGDKKWEKRMSIFCKPLTTGKIRYFDESEKEQAYTWIEEGVAVTA